MIIGNTDDFLKQFGDIENNSLINTLQTDEDEDENQIQMQIITNSAYYDCNDDFMQSLAKTQHQFSIFSTNIQYIRTKFDEFNVFIEILKQNMFEFSVICIQETWLSENDDTSCFKIEGYNLIPQVKSCSQKGGLLIYLQDRFEYDYKYKLNTYSAWEGQIIQGKMGDSLNKTVNIGNIYRPPKDINECYKE